MSVVDYYKEPFLREEVSLPDGTARPLLRGRHAIVTGGGKGIGKGITLRLAAAGADVLICGNGNMDMAEATAEEARAFGVRVETLRADLASEDAAELIASEAVRLFGGIDILVSNAAYQPNLDLDGYTAKRFSDVMEINLFSPLRLISACAPYLKKSECGRVIIVSSVHGKKPTSFDAGYATSKGGLQMLLREAAIELRPFGVTVNAILPGGTAVEFKSGETFSFPSVKVERERKYPRCVGLGKPGDMGNLAVFLASDLSSYLTGVSIRVDGGLLLF